MMRAAAGGPAVPSRSRPAQAGEEARGCVCGGGAVLGVRPAPGAPGPGGGGAPGSAAATAPPAAGALPEQRRSVARLGASSAGLLALLAFLLRGLLLLLPRPRRPLLQPAPPLPPCLPLLALSALTFPSPGQRRRAPRQPPAPLQTAGCERGCALYPVPAPRGRSGENRTMPGARDQGAARARWLGIGLLGLFLLPVSLSLEVSVGKATTIYAVNGTEILLPCTFSSCFGFENLHFWWSYNSSDTYKILIDGTVKNEKSDPKVKLKDDDRITLEGSTKEKMNNISISLKNLEFSDTGKYTCHVKNPKENDFQHQATIFLQVVDKLEEVDNTVTLIILGVVGGVIGLLIFILLVKKFIAFIIKKTQEKKKECLVSSSGNDNTENGLPGSKAEEKAPTKV